MTSSSRRAPDPVRLARVAAAVLLLAAPALLGQDTKASTRPLANEKSPYLRQHLDNPVVWYPWGDEAFAKAEREGKPVFLSIGYASCHWCHVMEHESFENADVARVLNESYVPIKVDREERPDVDRVYMQAATAMIGRGGWPLSVFLTPDRKPFYAGTYFPLEDQPNQTGFKTVIVSIREAWKQRRATLVEAAGRLSRVIQMDQLSAAELEGRARGLESRAAAESATRPEPGPIAMELAAIKEILSRKTGAPTKNLLARASEQLLLIEDKEYGGFGEGMKFPMPFSALMLLRLNARGKAPAALAAVERQCDAMALGGIRDYLAGGFHRYATDRKWEIPHFEKMLYDQAFLARLYLELALAKGGRGGYERVCRETLDFCLARMRAPDGGFIAAFDATIGGEEGATYLWTKEEIEAALPGDENERLRKAVVEWAGFDRAKPGEKLTLMERQPPSFAAQKKMFEARLIVDQGRKRLLAARDQRAQPAAVAHVITGWNAWIVSALARAGMVLNEPTYLTAAIETIEFLDRKLRQPDGLYARRFTEGEARFAGELSDQAAMAEALLDLHEATLDSKWLERAAELVQKIEKKFGRPDGSFDDSVEPDLIFRTRDTSDGAVPSGISQMNVALARLARITGKPADLDRAKRAIEAILPDVSATPSEHPYGTIAWDLVFAPVARIAFSGPKPVLMLLRAPLLLTYRPHVVMTMADEGELATDDPRASATVWFDRRRSVQAFDAAELLRLLDGAESRPESR